MWINKLGNNTRLLLEVPGLIARQVSMENLDRRLHAQPRMLAQVDLRESAAAQQGDQAIVPKCLSNQIGHKALSLHAFHLTMSEVIRIVSIRSPVRSGSSHTLLSTCLRS